MMVTSPGRGTFPTHRARCHGRKLSPPGSTQPHQYLEDVASVYGGSITYEDLASGLFERTGYRTRMLLGNWIGQVLGPVQSATLADGKPPLSSLVVHAQTGGVGEGYVNHQHPEGFTTSTERQQAAAVDRLTCYRVYCDHVPEDAEPQMTALYHSKKRGRAAAAPPPLESALVCFTSSRPVAAAITAIGATAQVEVTAGQR